MLDIKKLREKHKLTQVELANILGYSSREIQRWEKGANIRPLIERAIKKEFKDA
jgi:DNA-binding transcriptional regulator YiaG